MTRIADIVAETLHAYGVRYAFGMPGGEVVTLIDALEAVGIRFILCRHETAAAIMAAGASAVTGAPGLLVTTLGPGLANAVNGIADAAQEHVPLIVMSGVVEHGLRGCYTHQIFDQTALMQPVTKGRYEIEARRPGATTARALRLALQPQMGPVFLQLSPDTAAQTAEPDERPAARPKLLPVSPDPTGEAVESVAALLQKARRPLILAGLEAARDDAGVPLRHLMERFQAPLITTYKAKGVVDETHPLTLGGAGLSPLADKELLPLAQSADLILLAGYDPIEMRPGWLEPFAADAEIVEISSAPPDHGMHSVMMQVCASPRLFLDALLTQLGLRESEENWSDGKPAEVRETLRTLFTPPSAWGAHSVFDRLQKLLPDDAIVTADSGAHRILASQQMQIRRPFGLMQSAGFCTMGAAIPLAAGAKIAQPGCPVVAILGDGGLEMGLGELATLRDQVAPVVVIVLQDESLALIELKQAQAGLTQRGVSLGRTKFEEIAPAMGGKGWRVNSCEALESALKDSLGSDVFSVIVCDIQVSDYVGKF